MPICPKITENVDFFDPILTDPAGVRCPPQVLVDSQVGYVRLGQVRLGQVRLGKVRQVRLSSLIWK
jgi:hypothetical protein